MSLPGKVQIVIQSQGVFQHLAQLHQYSRLASFHRSIFLIVLFLLLLQHVSLSASRSDKGSAWSNRSLGARCRNSIASLSDEHPHIGNYRLLKTIGKGNFAKVKLARHILTGREVQCLCVFSFTYYRSITRVSTFCLDGTLSYTPDSLTYLQFLKKNWNRKFLNTHTLAKMYQSRLVTDLLSNSGTKFLMNEPNSYSCQNTQSPAFILYRVYSRVQLVSTHHLSWHHFQAIRLFCLLKALPYLLI